MKREAPRKRTKLALFTLGLALGLCAPSVSRAKGGGGGGTGAGNSGGGIVTSQIIGPNGPWTFSEDKDLRSLRDKGVRISNCRESHSTRIPELPGKIVGRIEVRDAKGARLELQDICSSERLARAYQDLAVTLHRLAPDPVFEALLDRAVRAGSGPVQFRVHEHGRVMQGRGHRLLEPAWFDPTFGGIGWSRPELNPTQFSLRGQKALLMHELGHVLTFRVFGGYPEVEYWHDFRRLSAAGDDSLVKREHGKGFYSMRTSREAALIETLSNILEVSFDSGEHPMDDRREGYAVGFFKKASSGNYELEMGAQEASKRISCDPRLYENEAFLTTGMFHLLDRSYYDPAIERAIDADNPGTLGASARELGSREALVDWIDAVVAAGAPDLFRILSEFDRVRGMEEGRAFTLSYFLVDPDTGSCIGEKLTRSKRKDSFGKTQVVLATNALIPPSRIFEQKLDQIDEAIRWRRKRAKALRLSRAELARRIQATVAELTDAQRKLIDIPSRRLGAIVSSIAARRLSNDAMDALILQAGCGRELNLDISSCSRLLERMRSSADPFGPQLEILRGCERQAKALLVEVVAEKLPRTHPRHVDQVERATTSSCDLDRTRALSIPAFVERLERLL